MTPDIQAARLRALRRGREVRVVGLFGNLDVTVLEDRLTGERRRVPNKWLLMAAIPAVAFELVPAGAGFEDEAPLPDEE